MIVNARLITAVLICAACVAFLTHLGFWQLDRLQWKLGLLQKISAEQNVDPKTVKLESFVNDPKAAFKRGTLRGYWAADQTVKVGPRMQDGQVGHWLITPLSLTNRTSVLINRGWIAEDAQTPLPRGYASVRGSLRESDGGGKPVGGNPKYWHRFDIAAIAKAQKIDSPASLALFMESSNPADPAKTIPAPVVAQLRNAHLQYAIFWFVMAGLAVAMFYFSLRGKRSISTPDPSGL